jgi:D-glycerate 3-kinase
MSTDRELALQELLQQQRLPEAYLATAAQWFDPVATAIAAQKTDGEPLLVGLNGSQGSGKSTLAEYLKLLWQYDFNLHTETLSLDDVYLTHAQRLQLADTVHPLLATRGVPGTHDIALAQATLERLQNSATQSGCRVPRFDKASDDRQPESQWHRVDRPVDIILFEGWCLGVDPQQPTELDHAVNELEQNEDSDGHWRGYVNDAIARDYIPLYDLVQHWVMLKAPSFDCVYRWRLEQEDKLRLSNSAGKQVMDAAGVTRFIQHYQRLTEHGLRTLPDRVDHCLHLDSNRQVTRYTAN